MVDVDASGSLSYPEFEMLYEVIDRSAAQRVEAQHREAEERRRGSLFRQLFGGSIGVVLLLLAIVGGSPVEACQIRASSSSPALHVALL